MSSAPPLTLHEQGKHIPALDGLRGLAVLLVLFFHFTRTYTPAVRFGWAGVDLFFVLSGFLITGILLDTRTKKNYFKNFIARRALRIFPLFYFTLFVFLVVCMVWPTPYVRQELGGDYFLDKSAWYWTYFANWLIVKESAWLPTEIFNHLWSLAIEEQFYLVWPFVVWVTPTRLLTIGCVALIFGALVFRVYLVLLSEQVLFAYVSTPARLDSLAMGALLAIVFRRGTGFASIRHLALPTIIACLVLLAAMIGYFHTMDNLHPMIVTAGMTVNLFLFGALLVLATSRTLVQTALSTSFMTFFGKYSYALYIFHVPVYHILAMEIDHHGSFVMKAVIGLLAFVISIALAMGTWVMLEQPFLRLKRYF